MKSNSSKVHFLPWNKKNNLSVLLKAGGLPELFDKNESVAIKAHFGEKGNKGHVNPKYFLPIIKMALKAKTHPFLTDTNTIYHGARNNAASHLEIAAMHGFSTDRLGVPIIIADGDYGHSYKEIKIDGRHFQKVKIGQAIARSDMIIAVSHFKGHLLAGFGGAIKNLGMGCGSRVGKFEMHSSVSPSVNLRYCTGCGACVTVCSQGALKVVGDKIVLDAKKCAGCGECILACSQQVLGIKWSEPGKNVQEKFAEYAKGAVRGKKIFCVTFVNHITANCDCVSFDETPLMSDVGILASKDPVAIDQAAFDSVLKKAGYDVFRKAHPNIDYNVQLVHAEKMGLGTRRYELVQL